MAFLLRNNYETALFSYQKNLCYWWVKLPKPICQRNPLPLLAAHTLFNQELDFLVPIFVLSSPLSTTWPAFSTSPLQSPCRWQTPNCCHLCLATLLSYSQSPSAGGQTEWWVFKSKTHITQNLWRLILQGDMAGYLHSQILQFYSFLWLLRSMLLEFPCWPNMFHLFVCVSAVQWYPWQGCFKDCVCSLSPVAAPKLWFLLIHGVLLILGFFFLPFLM